MASDAGGAPSPTTGGPGPELESSRGAKTVGLAVASEDSDGEEEEGLRLVQVQSGSARWKQRRSDATLAKRQSRKSSDEGPALSLQERAWAMAENDAKRHLRAARDASAAGEGVPPG